MCDPKPELSLARTPETQPWSGNANTWQQVSPGVRRARTGKIFMRSPQRPQRRYGLCLSLCRLSTSILTLFLSVVGVLEYQCNGFGRHLLAKFDSSTNGADNALAKGTVLFFMYILSRFD